MCKTNLRKKDLERHSANSHYARTAGEGLGDCSLPYVHLVFFPPEDPLSDPKLESQFPLILVPLLKSFAKLFTVERRVVERFSFHYFKIASL